ncbi:PKD domain-containing protein, partial [Flavobacterium croceum]|uniref:PKD domain-containing protein n=1 Tax=Flavobacterium croceum TaxID=370975 RepID=UPI0024A86C52
MRKLLLLFSLIATLLGFSQTYTMLNGANGTISTCGGTFVDNGGSSMNYSANQSSTITFCPTIPGNKIKISFSSFVTEGSGATCYDYLDVWYSSTITNPTTPDATFCGSLSPFELVSTDATGCITFRFTSNPSIQKAGWVATISCIVPCNPPIPVLSGSTIVTCSPSSATPGSFTHSFNAGGSYSPSGHSISSYEWIWGDGTTTTTTTPTTTHTFPSEGIYDVKLSVRDNNYGTNPLGCLSTTSAIKTVKILPKPLFIDSTSPTINLTVGQSTSLTGSVKSQTITQSTPSFNTPPLSLPDGTGVSYTSSLNLAGFFPIGQTVSAGCYPTISFSMEHSFASDISIELIAPNGQSVMLFNRHGGGSNFGTCVNGNDDGVPGCPATYSVANSGGVAWTSSTCYTNTSTSCSTYSGSCELGQYYIPQLYNSTQPMSSLIGAPMNGLWTIKVTDYVVFDDGVLTGWGINFPNSCYNTITSVTPLINSVNWTHTGLGPAIPPQSTTFTSVTDPGPDACAVLGTCIGNIATNTINLGPFLTPGTYIYTVTATDEYLCQIKKDITIIVTGNICTLTQTSAPATSNQTICFNSSITPITYNYTGSPSNINVSSLPLGVSYTTIGNTTTISGTPTTSGIYNYTISTIGCTTNDTKNGTIIINNPSSPATISGTNTLCVGSTSTLTASISGGTWASANTAIATVSASGVVTAVASGSVSIDYTIPASGACPAVVSHYTITVTNPSAPATISGTNTLCVGSTSTLTASISGGTWASA